MTTRTLALTAATCAAVTSLGLAGMTSAAASTGTSRPAVTVHVTSTKHLDAPSRTEPGLAEIHNSGATSVYLVRRVHGDLNTFVADYNSSTSTGFDRDEISVDHFPARSTIYVGLSVGTYYLVDGDPFPIKKAWVATMTVTGRSQNAAAPSSYAVTINSRNALSAPASMSPSRYLRIRSSSAYSQQIDLYRVGASVSDATVRSFVASPSIKKLSTLKPASSLEVGFFDPKLGAYTTWRATKGRYVLINLAYRRSATALTFGTGQAREITVK